MFTVEQFEAHIPNLPIEQRAYLCRLLQESLAQEQEGQWDMDSVSDAMIARTLAEANVSASPEDISPEQMDALHLKIVKTRLADVRAGRSQLIPADEVERQLFGDV